MKTKKLSLTAIKPYDGNPRKISPAAVAAVRKSIEDFGYNSPIIVDANDVIIMGHTRHAALTELGWTEVTVVVADHLTEIQVKKLRVIDNRVGELAEWDDDLLRDEVRAVGADGEMDAWFSATDLKKMLGALDEVPTSSSPTAQQIEQQQETSSSHFKKESERKASEMLEVPCPACKEVFFVDSKLAD